MRQLRLLRLSMPAAGPVLAAALALGASSHAAPAFGQADVRSHAVRFSIAPADLQSALLQLASQADIQIAVRAADTRGLSTNGLSGEFTVEQALAKILAGSGLQYKVDATGTVTVVPADAAQSQATAGQAASASSPVPSREQPAEEGGLEEIVVTAQKREQRLQDVPLSVAVLSASTLEANRVTGVEGLQQISPSISFTNSGNTRGQGVSIRGIGTLNFSDGVEPSVSTVVDGVVIGRSAATFFDFNDIDRIEVLRGPQGTLFGKNSSAGVLNVVTARPDLDEVAVDASASYGSYDDKRVKASVSTPLAPGRAALRLSSFYREADGIITNAVDGSNLNDAKAYGVRGKLLVAASDAVDVYVISDYSKSERNCCVSTVRSILPTTRYWGATGPTRASLFSGIALGPDNRTANVDGESFNDQDSWGTSVEVNADLGSLSFTSISAYREFSVFDNNDTDGAPIDIYNVNNARQNQHQFTQEFRLASPADAVLEYVVGAFYFSQGVDTKTQIRGTGNSVLPPSFVGNEIVRDINTQNMAPFGQLTWKVTDELRLLAGARYTTEDIHADFARTVYPGATGPSTLAGAAYTAPTLRVEGADDFSWRLGAQYHFTPDNMVYATYTRGYKGPAINLLNNISAAIVDSGQAILDPEIARNAEVGLRTTLFDRALTFNTTVFHTKFENFQAQTFNALLNTFTLDNAGELITKGVEVEAVLLPARGLTLSANVAYTDTEVRNFITGCYPGQTAAQGCGAGGRQDVTGSGLTNAPKWAYTVSADYRTPLGSLPYRGVVNLAYTHRSEVFFAYRDPNTVQPGYGLLNASLGGESRDGRYRLTVYGRNLTGERFASLIGSGFLDTSSAGAGYTQLLTTDSRRTYGVEFGMRF